MVSPEEEKERLQWEGLQKKQDLSLEYDTRCYFNVRSKADISQLIYRTEWKRVGDEKQ